MPRFHLAVLVSVCLLASASAAVSVRYAPQTYEVGPFPTNTLTVADPAQKTALRVNLPLPDCNTQPSTCAELGLLNQLDGFSLQPRMHVRFSGPINIHTLRDGVFVIWLDDLTREEFGLQPAGHKTTLDEVLYDPETQTAYAKTDEILSQHRRYMLIVTTGVLDKQGAPVEADPAFTACLAQTSGYCADVAQAVAQYSPQLAPQQIVAASVFTTMSATAWMEKAREAVHDSPINLQITNSFNVADLASVTIREQTQASPDVFSELSAPLDLLRAIGRVTFGSFQSPNFLNEQQVIPAVPTNAPVELPAAANTILFQVYLPATPAPPGGYPVIIAGHGFGGNRLDFATAIASTMNGQGYAVIAINAVGHGGGPAGQVVIVDKTGKTTGIPLGGRTIDLNGDHKYDTGEGCLIILGPQPVGLRDCSRQTALDLMQLVRVIKAGMDVTGDGVVDLDPARIYYSGASLGAIYGTVFNAIEPDVPAAALTVGGATVVDIVRWSPGYRPYVAAALGARVPSLLNKGTDFDEDYVLRYQWVKLIHVPGAVDIQEFLERLEWFHMTGDPLAFAPHLRQSPLPGRPYKRVLFQYGYGDETVPNPAETRLILTANMHDTTVFYRHDIARQIDPNLPENPHAYIAPLGTTVQITVAIATQLQIAGFLPTGQVPDLNPAVRLVVGKNLFENPPFLTQDLNFGLPRPQVFETLRKPWFLRQIR